MRVEYRCLMTIGTLEQNVDFRFSSHEGCQNFISKTVYVCVIAFSRVIFLFFIVIKLLCENGGYLVCLNFAIKETIIRKVFIYF